MLKFMLPTAMSYEDFKSRNWYGYVASEKKDGIRAMLYKKRRMGVKILNKKGYDVTLLYPEIVESVKNIDGDFVIDGEICAESFEKTLVRNKSSSFNTRMLSKLYPTCFYGFDCLELDGEDLRFTQLRHRLKKLEEFNSGLFFKVVKSDLNTTLLFEEVEKRGGEGIVLKRLDSLYVGYKSDNWKKVKCWNYKEIRFNSYEKNPDNSITLENEKGIRVKVGRDVEKVRQKLNKQGFIDIEVQYLTENTETGKYRFPTYHSLA